MPATIWDVERKARKHWRRVEVLLIVLVVVFIPALFLASVPESGSFVRAPGAVFFGAAPVVSAWLVIELAQFLFLWRRPGGREYSSATLANLYFLAWVAFIFSALFVTYVAFGDIEWMNYFYNQLPPLLRVWLTAFAVIVWLKLLPVIFYKRSRPVH